MLNRIEDKVLRGERLTSDEGVWLLTEAPLVELGALANELRTRKTDPRIVTYVIDTNPNYTNWCTVDCHFCAFYRKTGKPAADGYTHDVEGVMRMMETARGFGATTVLLQGGLNPEIQWEFYTSIVREARKRYPEITPHFFSAPESHQMVEVSGLSIRGVLEALYAAGQRTLPGGGAEILATRVRKRISIKKGGPEAWLDVHRAAHAVGMRSTATMMYGHVETPAEMVERRLSLVCDRRAAMSRSALAAGLAKARSTRVPVLEAQFHRALALADRDPGKMSAAIEIWERIGAVPQLGRGHAERGLLSGDPAETEAGLARLKKLGDLNYVDNFAMSL